MSGRGRSLGTLMRVGLMEMPFKGCDNAKVTTQ
jgi:hypothetical protein